MECNFSQSAIFFLSLPVCSLSQEMLRLTRHDLSLCQPACSDSLIHGVREVYEFLPLCSSSHIP